MEFAGLTLTAPSIYIPSLPVRPLKRLRCWIVAGMLAAGSKQIGTR